MSATPLFSEPTLIDELLEEQAQLTAVERFARQHADWNHAPAQERYYQALIPLNKPGPGEQYAFSVNLDACTGCKACVSACHSLNGLDEHETWRSTGLLHGGTVLEPYQQVVTTACHHCLDPACASGCPVLAYEKDPATGIVQHLDDQCIGCQYCVLKCPYDVPQYSAKRGIVRKCDLCHGRLTSGEAPACVQACPSGAISIQIVSQAATAERCSTPDQRLLPGTIFSAYTQPTTVYSSRRPVPANALPGDAHQARPQPPHWPLIWMLLLTQLATGMVLMSGLLSLPRRVQLFEAALATSAVFALHAGLITSVFHLGRPLGAWRAFLGWRRSWMSREILAFGCFSAVGLGWAAASVFASPGAVPVALNSAAAAIGLVSVFCSAMIYVDTRRVSWNVRNTFVRFFGATLLLGAAATAALLTWLSFLTGMDTEWATHVAAWLAIGTRFALFVWELLDWRGSLTSIFNVRFGAPTDRSRRRQSTLVTTARKSARTDVRDYEERELLIRHHFRGLLFARLVLFILSTVSGLLALRETAGAAAFLVSASFLATFASSLIERYFFFTAVIPPKMPGGALP